MYSWWSNPVVVPLNTHYMTEGQGVCKQKWTTGLDYWTHICIGIGSKMSVEVCVCKTFGTTPPSHTPSALRKHIKCVSITYNHVYMHNARLSVLTSNPTSTCTMHTRNEPDRAYQVTKKKGGGAIPHPPASPHPVPPLPTPMLWPQL